MMGVHFVGLFVTAIIFCIISEELVGLLYCSESCVGMKLMNMHSS